MSLNLLDAWYDLISSDDTWKQHVKDKIKNLGEKGGQCEEPEMSLLPLQVLGGGHCQRGGRARHFQAFHWTNVFL